MPDIVERTEVVNPIFADLCAVIGRPGRESPNRAKRRSVDSPGMNSLQGTTGSRAFQNARLQKKYRKHAEALMSAAYAAYGNGRHAEVEAACRQVLQVLPDHFDALHLLGASLIDRGRLDEAVEVLRGAVAVSPRSADAHCDLGAALSALKRYDEARVCQEKAIALNPKFPMALTNLGNTLMHLGRPGEAIEFHNRAIALKPDYADAYCNRGMAQMWLGQWEQVAHSFERALTFAPRHVEALVGRGMVALEFRRHEAAGVAFKAALELRPKDPKVLAHRGRLHMQLGRLLEAEADFDAALALAPGLEVALRGKVLLSLLFANPTQAFVACTKLLEQNPRSAIAIALMGSCLAAQGEVVSAIEHFDRALEIKPDLEDVITRKIFALDFLPDADVAVLQTARSYWWNAIGAAIPRRTLSPRRLEPERRIIIGYVSADFRRHSAGFTFLPVLRHHDHSKFEIICYSCSPQQDEVTAEFQSIADRWVDAVSLTDDELADRIQADQVDILVDLSGHSADNRLKVFASKPAPVQVSAWGNPTGTGLKTMDYIFADPVAIPQAVRRLFAETIHDLPCMLTATPSPEQYRPALPMMRNGHVTFGVFNRTEKISDRALAVWSRLLCAMPEAKIVIKHGALDDLRLRDELVARFVAHGVAHHSVICLGRTARTEHLLAYQDIDISLDPFPQNGGASTWESLHMGVPVIARLGHTPSSRAAGAILKAIGLDDWVTSDDDSYVEIAKKFAEDAAGLAQMRKELPARIASSAAGNGETYTRCVEAGYRQFWRHYCLSQGPTSI